MSGCLKVPRLHRNTIATTLTKNRAQEWLRVAGLKGKRSGRRDPSINRCGKFNFLTPAVESFFCSRPRSGEAAERSLPPTAADDVTFHLSCIPSSTSRVQEATGGWTRRPGPDQTRPDQSRSQVCSKAGWLKYQYHRESHQMEHLANLLDLSLISCHKESMERI